MSKLVYFSWIPVAIFAVYGCATMNKEQINIDCITPAGQFSKENVKLDMSIPGMLGVVVGENKTLYFGNQSCIILKYVADK